MTILSSCLDIDSVREYPPVLYIIEDKIFEKILSSNAIVYWWYVLSILHCRTNSGKLSRPAAGRIDTAYFNLPIILSRISQKCYLLFSYNF